MRASTASDEGFGLVEVMVAMLIFGILAVAAVPLFITSHQVSAKNASIAFATQLVHEGLEVARAEATGGTCADMDAAVDAIEGEDPRGVAFDVSGSVTCTSNLATVVVQATTTSPGFANPVARAETRVYVENP